MILIANPIYDVVFKYLLEVFSQDTATKNSHNIEIAKESTNSLVKKMVKRLSKAASSEIIKRKMEAEDMIERLINKEAQERLKEQAEVYEKKLEEKDEELNAKDEVINIKDKQLEELLKEIEQLRNQVK